MIFLLSTVNKIIKVELIAVSGDFLSYTNRVSKIFFSSFDRWYHVSLTFFKVDSYSFTEIFSGFEGVEIKTFGSNITTLLVILLILNF